MPSPRPHPSRRATALSRRATLLGVLGTATLACSPYELQTQQRRPGRPTPTAAAAPPATDPDVALATTVVAAERSLLAQLDATVRRHPRLERLLAVTREVHDAHVALLEDAVPPAEDSEASDSSADVESTPDAGGEAETEPGRVPRDPGRALRALATAEDALVLSAKQAAFTAQSGAFARVLASLAAGAAQQSAVLRTTRLGGGRR